MFVEARVEQKGGHFLDHGVEIYERHIINKLPYCVTLSIF